MMQQLLLQQPRLCVNGSRGGTHPTTPPAKQGVAAAAACYLATVAVAATLRQVQQVAGSTAELMLLQIAPAHITLLVLQ
jgi:hypothetical protein